MVKITTLPPAEKKQKKINKSKFILVAKRVQKSLKEEAEYLAKKKRNENYYSNRLFPSY